MPNFQAKTFFFGHRHFIGCKMPNFQVVTLDFWSAETVLASAVASANEVRGD